MTTGQRIRDRRKELGLTQKQLGELCGMADSAIRKYESGRITPKHQTLKRIANALRVSEWNLAGISFEDHIDGSSVAIVDGDNVDVEVAQRLTIPNNPYGRQFTFFLNSDSEKEAFKYFVENGCTSPEQTVRLLIAFNKMSFPLQQMLIRVAEDMAKEALRLSAGEGETPIEESDNEE